MLDPSAVRAMVGPRTRAILAFHWAGDVCDLDAIGEVAREAGVPLVSDASEALGARWQGRALGSHDADHTIYSFGPVRQLTAIEGGAIISARARDDAYLRRAELAAGLEDSVRVRVWRTLDMQDCWPRVSPGALAEGRVAETRKRPWGRRRRFSRADRAARRDVQQRCERWMDQLWARAEEVVRDAHVANLARLVASTSVSAEGMLSPRHTIVRAYSKALQVRTSMRDAVCRRYAAITSDYAVPLPQRAARLAAQLDHAEWLAPEELPPMDPLAPDLADYGADLATSLAPSVPLARPGVVQEVSPVGPSVASAIPVASMPDRDDYRARERARDAARKALRELETIHHTAADSLVTSNEAVVELRRFYSAPHPEDASAPPSNARVEDLLLHQAIGDAREAVQRVNGHSSTS
jgi:hypothetical protein